MPANLGLSHDADLKRLKLLSMALRIGSFGYFIQDVLLNRVTWSAETYDIWGISPSIGRPSLELINKSFHPEDYPRLAEIEADTSWTSKVLNFRIVRPDGEVRYIQAHIEREFDNMGALALAYGILLDNTVKLRTELALQSSEARLTSLFETTGAGMVITGPRANILFVNKSFANLLGYEPSELLGRSIRSLSPPDTNDATLEMVRAMRAGEGLSRDVEKPYLHRDGHMVWVRLTINIHTNFNGDEEFIGIIQDLSERHRAEERLRDNEHLLNAAQTIGMIGHWVWHMDTGVIEWSEEMCRIVGYPPDDRILRGHRMEKHVHPDDVKVFRSMLDQIRDGSPAQSHEFRLIRVDGELRTVIGRAMPIHATTGRGERLIGTIQDITEAKARENALRRESVKAEAANRAKTLFLANMSHELRTPLNAILGFAQLLSIGTRGGLNGDQKEYVNSIMRGGEHLLRLINDVLDLSRIDSGHLTLSFEPINLLNVTQDVLQSFSQQAAARSISLNAVSHGGAPEIVSADRVRLTQVLVNLISNAVKFNRTGGEVCVDITAVNEQHVRLAISDTGHGIPRDRHNEVFQHFNRLGAESQGIEGTGIGLALSKRLVEEMNGAMGFDSEPHVRTTFWFDLPTTAVHTSPVLRAAQ
ncbi:MAG: PAS domain S-box protein [Rhodospirillaceae bacterium]|nr:PAS domain S-box protein [Rhodospirillaceae bacterium]